MIGISAFFAMQPAALSAQHIVASAGYVAAGKQLENRGTGIIAAIGATQRTDGAWAWTGSFTATWIPTQVPRGVRSASSASEHDLIIVGLEGGLIGTTTLGPVPLSAHAFVVVGPHTITAAGDAPGRSTTLGFSTGIGISATRTPLSPFLRYSQTALLSDLGTGSDFTWVRYGRWQLGFSIELQ